MKMNKEIILSNGLRATKPDGFTHSPAISHSIVPAKRIDFNLWGEIVRAEFRGIHQPDAILVKKYYL